MTTTSNQSGNQPGNRPGSQTSKESGVQSSTQSGARAGSQDSRRDITVATWNVWRRGGPWEQRHKMIIDALEFAAADVITLQQTWVTNDRNQPAEIAAALGLEHVQVAPYAGPSGPDGQRIVLAVISRWPLRDAVSRALPSALARSQGRGMLGVVVDHPAGALPLVTTHLNSSPTGSGDRVSEVRAVAELTGELAGAADADLGPIVTGDLNAEPGSDEVRLLGGLLTAPAVPGLGLEDVWHYADPAGPGYTWRWENSFLAAGTRSARIDYILVGLSTGVLGARMIGLDPVDGVHPSTHAGVCAKLLLRPAR
ncbi:endonuclease/exonuclease/phosphatase family protein [Microlunatus sp. Gsoil 973]|uniref:endonuclease/exonuclease/phosphatase family protein n=1 Tax=Microlunatus sp. Gsoil 973 TaxID=2672569 RepID=UPI0012B44F92|nr:endonuclease/exonuclease/phosphatase family protein [Microlunatus sp. Gsoil 973]QGN34054.1 endonuclease [Microlunatus sp. Gsoil 973]